MDKAKFKVQDGCIIELGPRAIVVEPADIHEWNRLKQEQDNENLRRTLRPILIWLLCTVVAIVVLAVAFIALGLSSDLFVTCLGVLALMSMALAWTSQRFFSARYQKTKAEIEEKRQALLKKYGEYKLDEVTTLENWYYGWRAPPYVLVAKGDL